MSTQNLPAFVATFFLVASAGCFGGGKDKDGDDDDGQIPLGDVPEAVISIRAAGLPVAMENGSYPAQVGQALTFDASGSLGTNLLYSWDFGDGTTSQDTAEDHAFDTPGTFNVTLTVANGNLTDNSSAPIVVADPTIRTFAYVEPFDFDGDLPLGNPNTPTTPDVDYRDHAVTIVAVSPDGLPVIATNITITLDGSGATAVDATLYWRDSSGNIATEGPGGLDHTIQYDEDMPAGDYAVRVRLNTGAQMSYTVHAEVTYMTSASLG